VYCCQIQFIHHCCPDGYTTTLILEKKEKNLIEYTIENVHFYDFYEKESITLL